MEETAPSSDEVAQAVAAYLAASDAALRSMEALNDAWRQHFEAQADAPSQEWIADVASQQMASDLALGRARAATEATVSADSLETGSKAGSDELPVQRKLRRRRRENKFLASLGKPGKRLLRAGLMALLVMTVLVATGAGISLALEIAGFLHLIDDPVELPVGIQLLIFLASAGAAYGLKRALKPVERALYGSKGIRPQGFQL